MRPTNLDNDNIDLDHEQTTTTQQNTLTTSSNPDSDAVLGMATSTSGISSNAMVSRVAIKAPPFYRRNPAVWFRQMESQFVLGGVSTDVRKFHHVLASLPEDVAVNLSIDINSYEELKNSVIQLFQKSKNELLEEALGSISLDGEKPSVCLVRIQRKLSQCNLALGEDVIKHRLMQAMPFATRTALSAHTELSLTQFAKLADTIYSYSKESTVAAVSLNSFNSTAPQHRQSSPHHRQEPARRDTAHTTTSGLQPFAAGQRPKICRFHLYYAQHAKRCKPWCKWPGEKPATIDPTSRANSPARSQPGN